jgi:aldose 1-epimerase
MVHPVLVTLHDGDSICTLYPALGGSIAGWSVGGQTMLRRTDTAAVQAGDVRAGEALEGDAITGDVRDMAGFPLVPFSNRIGDARFVWAGRAIALTPNFAPEPHAHHGIGWQARWDVVEKSDSHMVLGLQHPGNARWPWPFAATQRIQLENGALALTLNATNLADEPTPLGFGYHPYFDSEGASLTFAAARVWMNGPDALPTKAVRPDGSFDFSRPSQVSGRTVDHCYTGWDGRACLSWENRQLALEVTTDMTAAIPSGGSAFCFEPVPHINNALNRPGDEPAMPTVAPGAQFTARIILRAVARI